jgi:hypothetical protein
MKNQTTTISFTQVSDGIIVPSHLLEEPSSNKKSAVLVAIFLLVAWILLISMNKSIDGIKISSSIILGFSILFFLILKFHGHVWIEFNRNTGNITLWRNMKKGGKIGDYSLEQVQFKVGTSGVDGSYNYNMTMVTTGTFWKQKYVLFDFFALDPTSMNDKPVVESIVGEIGKFISEFMSEINPRPFQKKEFVRF